MTKPRRRLLRQIETLGRKMPALKRPSRALLGKGWSVIRVPSALLLILGGLLAFLPVLGIWMLPLGLMLLAVDVPVLQNPMSSVFIRSRRWVAIRRRAWRRIRSRK